MKNSTLSALVVLTSLAAASGALAQDSPAAGKTSFNNAWPATPSAKAPRTRSARS